MSQRRMFSPQIVSSDAFLDMPTSSRELYFQLGMFADDDGFINPKRIIRMIGSSEDDLKILLSKRFLLPFDNGVVVIKHWKINNLVRKDWYRETQYLEQKKLLFIKENGSYTEDLTKGIPLVNELVNSSASEVRLGKVINTPASQDLLKVKKTKTMKKNTFGRYREDMSTDSFETVIDADTGEEEKYKPKGSNAKLMAELIEWAVKRRGGNFVNLGKQYKAISNLKQAKIPPEAIKNRWIELEGDEYHKLHGLDFMSIASSFDKKPL